MLVFRQSRRTLPLFTLMGGLMAGGFLPGCGSERRVPLPVEAKTPGELRLPKIPQDHKALAKNVNPNAPRSIKELQKNP